MVVAHHRTFALVRPPGSETEIAELVRTACTGDVVAAVIAVMRYRERALGALFRNLHDVD
ncbi:MAG: hypothetical protein P4L69_14795 [Desulfosporosinus sp.]|nr:hypothetical protein [Desulfosporosinus sp.]